jgi:hypothetical protein
MDENEVRAPHSLSPSDPDFLQSIPPVGSTERLEHLRLALATLQQRVHLVAEEIAREMERLGLPMDKTALVGFLVCTELDQLLRLL